jgi:hypothetical protein
MTFDKTICKEIAQKWATKYFISTVPQGVSLTFEEKTAWLESMLQEAHGVLLEEANKWEKAYDEIQDPLLFEIRRDRYGETETYNDCIKRVLADRDQLINALKECLPYLETTLARSNEAALKIENDTERFYCEDICTQPLITRIENLLPKSNEPTHT